jgi:hypothetical protein
MATPRARVVALDLWFFAVLVPLSAILLACGGSGDQASVADAGSEAAVRPPSEGGGPGDAAGGDAGPLADGSPIDATLGDASGLGDGAPRADGATGDASDAATADPGSQSAPTTAADPATYNQAIYYKIRNNNSGRLLSILGGGTSDGDTAVLDGDVNGDDQLWTIQDS